MEAGSQARRHLNEREQSNKYCVASCAVVVVQTRLARRAGCASGSSRDFSGCDLGIGEKGFGEGRGVAGGETGKALWHQIVKSLESRVWCLL